MKFGQQNVMEWKALQKFTKWSRSSGPCGHRKKYIVNVSSPLEGLLGDRGQHCFFKTTHEKASHAGCHFGTHAGTEHLLVVLAIKGDIVVSQNNVHEATESIKLFI